MCVCVCVCVCVFMCVSNIHTLCSSSPLFMAPLFSLLPRDVELRLVGNHLTGSFDAADAVGCPTNPVAGC